MLNGISVIIPTYNEEDNIPELLSRIKQAFADFKLPFEIIFIDDNSLDGTVESIKQHQESLPVTIIIKDLHLKKGKADSLLLGFDKASYDNVCMIDADLQYPPEAIIPMYEKLKEYDIVVANRIFENKDQREFLSHGFRFVFGKLLLGLDCDVQSGLKVFRKEILKFVKLNPTKWGFDFEFLFKAQKELFTIGSYDISFAERFAGESKISPLFSSIELGRASVMLKLTSMAMGMKFLDYPHSSEKAGVNWKNKDDFLFLPNVYSVKKHIFVENIHLFLFLLAAHVACFLVFAKLGYTNNFIVYTFVWINIFYLILLIFKFYVIYRSIRYNPIIDVTAEELAELKDSELPFYSVLIPLYQEEDVIGQIYKAMLAIDYPSDKIEFLITLEEYDHATREAIELAEFPDNFKIITLPDVKPKTKPKALNVAFSHMKGKLFTIYDAEIIPDKDQIKKAVIIFKRSPDIACIQTLLDHYNYDQNIITRWFNAEFSF